MPNVKKATSVVIVTEPEYTNEPWEPDSSERICPFCDGTGVMEDE